MLISQGTELVFQLSETRGYFLGSGYRASDNFYSTAPKTIIGKSEYIIIILDTWRLQPQRVCFLLCSHDTFFSRGGRGDFVLRYDNLPVPPLFYDRPLL